MDEHDGAEIRGTVANWWQQRKELAPDSAWDVPFPVRKGVKARVSREPAGASGATAETWRAALFRERATTAYIEVHSVDGPIAALESLYRHVA